jgi:outer membrane protein
MESAVRSAINSCAYTVRSCLLSAQDAFRSVQVSEKAVISARESYEDARMRYELQSGSYLDLLTAQTALSDAELAEISSRTSYLLALSQLYEAIGDIHPDLLKE